MDRIIRKIQKRNRRKGRFALKASATIEASLLMPLILGTIMLVIYLGFFLYGEILLEKAAESALLRAGNEREKEESVAVGELAVKEITEKKLAGPWEVESDVKAYEGKATVSLDGVMGFGRGLSGKLVSSDRLGFSIQRAAPRFDSGSYIRTVKKQGNGYVGSGTD
ncbi:MAG: pilus assembly protein [Lachnospiraceae bacterium]|nr:pilus assembly protein [Lachnospiraceae bacterium]MBR2276241.1 pilus assembly protein [Lachnospiraceae bacterium]